MASQDPQQRLIDQAHESRLRDNLDTGLSTLTFFDEPLTSAGLQMLAEQRPDLNGLYLMRTEVSDSGFDAINQFLALEDLDISETNLGPEAVQRISPDLPIRRLKLASQQVTAESFAHLAQFHTLEVLNCWNHRRPGDEWGEPMDEAVIRLTSLAGLRELWIGGHRLEAHALPAVASMHSLRVLGLSNTAAPAESLAALCPLTKLETLLMSETNLNDDALETLTCLRSLQHLSVSHTEITDRSVDTILRFGELRSLAIEGVKVSRRAAERLFELPKLEDLEIWLDGVDGEHWYQFIRERPRFHLEA